MKPYCILTLFIVSMLTAHAATFRSGDKYRIVCSSSPTGNLVTGAQHGSQSPLYYTTASGSNDAYWIVTKVAAGKYSLRNADTKQYITYNGVYSGSTQRYVTLTDSLHGDSSLWAFEEQSGYYAIASVAVPQHRFNLRSSGVVGTYVYSGGIGATGLHSFYGTDGAAVTFSTSSTSGLGAGIDSLSIEGKHPVWDNLYKTYMLSVPTRYRGETSFAARIHYVPVEEGDTLYVEDVKVAPDSTFTFTGMASDRQYQMEVRKGQDSIAAATMIFTFMPLVEITAPTLVRSTYNAGSIRVNDADAFGLDSLYTMKIRIRGATASGWNKKPYAVKLIDKGGNDIDRSFFGLREDNNWIFDAMAIDVARMRNRVTTDLWNEFATKPYYSAKEPKLINGTRGKMTEVVLNGSYAGIYCMTEKVDRKQLKLKKYIQSVVDGTPDTIRGELFKATTWSYSTWMGCDPSTKGFPRTALPSYSNTSASWGGWEAKYPDLGDGEKIDWGPFYTAVNVPATATDAVFASSVAKYFDLPVILDYYLLNELIEGFDNDGKNTYFYTYNMQKYPMFCIAPWDLDGTWGRNWNSLKDICDPTMDFAAFLTTQRGFHALFKRLNDSDYDGWNEKRASRYAELRKTFFIPEKLAARYNGYHALMKESGAEAREVKRWSGADVTLAFDDEMTYISDWVTKRIAALDKQYGYDPTGITDARASGDYIGVAGTHGAIVVHVNQAQKVRIYSVSGALVREQQVPAGVTHIDGLPAGIYIIGGKKVAVDN